MEIRGCEIEDMKWKMWGGRCGVEDVRWKIDVR